jgi:hypothetical protein
MEIRPDHGWETVGQGAPPGRGARGGGGSEPGWASHNPPYRVLGAWVGVPRPPTPARPGEGAPRREAGGEAEDGGGATTSAQEV